MHIRQPPFHHYKRDTLLAQKQHFGQIRKAYFEKRAHTLCKMQTTEKKKHIRKGEMFTKESQIQQHNRKAFLYIHSCKNIYTFLKKENIIIRFTIPPTVLRTCDGTRGCEI